MTNRQMGIVMVVIIVLTLIAAGLYALQDRLPPPATIEPEEPVACTLDAMLCPDGSYVGRVPPTCEFAACPDVGSPTSNTDIVDISNWKTYKNEEYGFEFKHPSSFNIVLLPESSNDEVYQPENMIILLKDTSISKDGQVIEIRKGSAVKSIGQKTVISGRQAYDSGWGASGLLWRSVQFVPEPNLGLYGFDSKELQNKGDQILSTFKFTK